MTTWETDAMRNISFMLTTDQVRRRIKTVTRRMGGSHLQMGDVLCGVKKGMGLKAGEMVVRIGTIRVLDVRPELLRRLIDDPEYGKVECIKEGFGDDPTIGHDGFLEPLRGRKVTCHVCKAIVLGVQAMRFRKTVFHRRKREISMFDEQEHQGAVKSRTHPTFLVAEPVVVMLDVLATELALKDAEALRDGLSAAVARVKESQSKLLGDGTNYNVAVLARAGSGMSFPCSKLGDEQSARPMTRSATSPVVQGGEG